MKIIYTKTLLALAALLVVLPAMAQFAPPPQHIEPYNLTLGQPGKNRSVQKESDQVTLSEVVRVEGAPWLRLKFRAYNLGQHSYIVMTSLEDGGQQRLDAKSLAQWNSASAFFNGDAVLLELHVAEGESGIFATLESLNVGERGVAAAAEDSGGSETQCGPVDNRVASTDNRAGRIINGCTAWLVSNGAVLTAGHCVDWDPDGGGPLLPDGVLDLWGSFSVNVPASDPDGTINQSAPEDQFPIDTSNVVWNYDGEGQGLGKDWAVFGIFPNANGERAHLREGFYRMTRQNPAANDSMRITGYGVDTGVDNKTLQTSAGPYVGEYTGGAATNIYHRYQVDTRGANSGSPIIWRTPSPDFTVGIHTNGGCGDPVAGTSNAGTSFEVDALEIAIRDFHGSGAKYVDVVPQPNNPGQAGEVFRHYVHVPDAVSNVPNNGRVILVKGTYTKAAGNTFTAGADGKAMTFLAPVGTVIIGN
ncbi:trypsin-like serine peptidase [Thiolapillus sp.]|uniref:trypsin-like serine peptidase n=1 Tax=Thiolapillus sp. TaxID=2017437 RepID=UPI003AF81DAD